MKKLAIVLLCLLLAGFCACGRGVPEEASLPANKTNAIDLYSSVIEEYLKAYNECLDSKDNG